MPQTPPLDHKALEALQRAREWALKTTSGNPGRPITFEDFASAVVFLEGIAPNENATRRKLRILDKYIALGHKLTEQERTEIEAEKAAWEERRRAKRNGIDLLTCSEAFIPSVFYVGLCGLPPLYPGMFRFVSEEVIYPMSLSFEDMIALCRVELYVTAYHEMKRIRRRLRRILRHFELFNEAYLVVNPRLPGESLFDLREREADAFALRIGDMSSEERRAHYRRLKEWKSQQQDV
ncbi:hypothetical protein AURDEDRAFT_174135 [Auricularia subglabra TFB-10046 SS5]|nr:hypothetical protein AURDEDRAFT_174135 [Auricularia subglabra TFB-10046 SS5]